MKNYRIEKAYAVTKSGDVLAMFLSEADARDFLWKLEQR